MRHQRLGALRLPATFWHRPDVRQSLVERDFGLLFRLLTKYVGASQTQIAIAVGMTQGQVSTIIAGSRRVTAIEVAERALDGLDAPDHARVAFGLAPRTASGSAHPQDGVAVHRGPTDTGAGYRDQVTADDDMDRRDVLRLGGVVFGSLLGVPGGVDERLVRISRALTSYSVWSGAESAGVERVPTVRQLASAVAQAKRDYQACRYSAVLDLLPGLLDSARLACQSYTGDELPRAWALAADAYQVAGSVMLKHRDTGLAALAADRSVDAAVRSQSPVALASSARIVTHSLMSAGHSVRAMEVASRAAERIAGDVTRPDEDALSVYGALLLRGAVAAAAAKSEDRQGAMRLVDEAGDAARRLGRDGNKHWTAFGPSNVAQHRVHIALVLGDAGTAVDVARRIDVDAIPIAERKAVLFIDTASALAQWGKYEQAYQALRTAEQFAPEEARTHKAARRLVRTLGTQAPGSVRARAREFAQHIGVEL